MTNIKISLVYVGNHVSDETASSIFRVGYSQEAAAAPVI